MRPDSRFAEIGPIADVVSPDRRAKCSRDLQLFGITYFADVVFKQNVDDSHIVEGLQEVILRGGPRRLPTHTGAGGTPWTIIATLFAALCGHRRYVLMVGPIQLHARYTLDVLKRELGSNDLLAQDFPEFCYPFRALGGRPQRCASQTCGGRPTSIEWHSDRVRLPCIPTTAAIGQVIRTRWVMSSFKGLAACMEDQHGYRPDLIVVDNPHTDASQQSLSEYARRERVVSQDLPHVFSRRFTKQPGMFVFN